MIRYTLLIVAIGFLSVYAWKDWYKALCGLIVLMAVVSYSEMPRAMFGIAGVSPFNFLFANVLASWLASFRKEGLKWDLPPKINLLLVAYLSILLVAIIRYGFTSSSLGPVYNYVQSTAPTTKDLLIDYFVNGIKWVLPACLLYSGCNSRERLKLGVLALMAMYLILALLVIKWMPLGLLTDGDALQRRAVRVLGREIGYFRTNLSVMFAGAFWVFIVARNYFSRRYSIPLGACAIIVLLAMFLTGGRGGYAAWIVVGLVFSFMKWRRYLILTPVLIIIIFSFVPSVQDRIFGSTEEVSENSVFDWDEETALSAVSAGRTQVWPRVVGEVSANPFIGHGFNGIVTSGVTLSLVVDYKITFFHPHNAYLQLLIDNGIVGTLPILLLFFVTLKTSWSLFNDHRFAEFSLAGGIAIAMVLSFLIAGMTGQSFYPEERSVGMWCAIALMARVAVQRNRNSARKADADSDWPD